MFNSSGRFGKVLFCLAVLIESVVDLEIHGIHILDGNSLFILVICSKVYGFRCQVLVIGFNFWFFR